MTSSADPPSARLRSLSRAVSALPGYHRVADRVLPRVRSNETFVELVVRLIGQNERLGTPSTPMVAPKGVDGEGADRWPVVVVTLDDPAADREPSAEEVAAVVAEVTALQERLRCFRAVFLVTPQGFTTVRASGHAVEVLPDPHDLEDPAAVRRHRARRVVSMTDHYRAWVVVDVPVTRRATIAAHERELLEALPGYLADQVDLHDLRDLPGVTTPGGTGRR
ncbi:hypothetical protein [Janibacter melonis]|uniref:hypothetical protein n=1 Tax=Janibacter melonis TaxID=262209 RepID=UPI0017877491|nr:hypothetical protein [Janibacter melonis]